MDNTDLRSIASNGRLRAAINTGNRALVQARDDGYGGVSPALARRLAATIGAELDLVVYGGAGRVFAEAEAGLWDLAFLAIDPARAEKVSFTRPYHRIEATYAMRTGAPFEHPVDVDSAGVTVLAAKGSAYELYLSKALRSASLERAGTPGDSFAAFRAGRGDVVAGVRASLEREFSGDPAYRVLSAVLTGVDQAMVLPGPSAPQIAALDAFVAQAIADGFVAAELDRDAG